MTFEIEFYIKPNGEEPAREFLLSLDKKMRAKMTDMILLLKENGNELRPPYSKYLKEGIFELRAKVGTDISRVLYFFLCWPAYYTYERIYKKTRKTPSQEIEKAIQFRSEYFQREVR